MLFNSVQFLIFFAVVFAVFWLARMHQLRVLILLVASYYFYMSWNAGLAVLVAASSLVDYVIARMIQSSEDQRRRKLFVTASVVMNLGLLFYFKYMNFFLQSLQEALERTGLHHQMPILKVVLPIGISFYTFEAISYTVDVYLKRTEAEKNPLHFLLFITFFPRMVAGPIIRARNFLPQLNRNKRFSWMRFDMGLQFILMGLFKKMAIADRMSILADPVYQSPGQYSTSAVWVGALAYSLQLYGDFSGYSDIALGTAHMLGFKLPENFNMPYISRNIAEFWRRWHISLSTWLRDYVFLPLGGGRRSQSRMSINLVITMTLCGLWHGANWTFVAFGVVQGVMQLVHHRFRDFVKPRKKFKRFLQSGPGNLIRIIVTYLTVVVLPSVLFRSPNFQTAATVFYRLFVPQHGIMVRYPIGPWALVFTFAVMIFCHIAGEKKWWNKINMILPAPARGLGYALLLELIVTLAPETQKAFIYFQF